MNDDINLQVASLNNQLRILQMQESKQSAIESTLDQIHSETIKQLEEQHAHAREERDQLVA